MGLNEALHLYETTGPKTSRKSDEAARLGEENDGGDEEVQELENTMLKMV